MPQPRADISFTVHMVPTAKGRPRSFVRGGRAMHYTPGKTDQAERDFIALADDYAPATPITGPIGIILEFVFPIPPSWSKRRQAAAHHHVGRPDVDNLVKLVTDAMNRSGRWWRDDAQVARITASKVYGAAPEIRVWLVECEP